MTPNFIGGRQIISVQNKTMSFIVSEHVQYFYFFLRFMLPQKIQKKLKKQLIYIEEHKHQNRICQKRYYTFNKLLFSNKVFEFYEGNILGIPDYPKEYKTTVLVHHFKQTKLIDKNQLEHNIKRLKQSKNPKLRKIMIKIHHYYFDEHSIYIIIDDLKKAYPLSKTNQTLAAVHPILKTFCSFQQEAGSFHQWDIFPFLIPERQVKILCIPPLESYFGLARSNRQLVMKISDLIMRYAGLQGYYYDKMPFDILEEKQIDDIKGIQKKLSQIHINNVQPQYKDPIKQYLNRVFEGGIGSITAQQLVRRSQQASKKLFQAIYCDKNHCKSPQSFPDSQFISEETIDYEEFRRVLQENETWIKFIKATISEIQKLYQPENIWEEVRYCLHKKQIRHLQIILNHKVEHPTEPSNKSKLAQQLGDQNRQRLSQIPAKTRQKQFLEEKIKKNQEIFAYLHEGLGEGSINIEEQHNYTSFKQIQKEYLDQLAKIVHRNFRIYLFSQHSKFIEQNLNAIKEKLLKYTASFIQQETTENYHKQQPLIRTANLWIRLFFIKMEDNQEFIEKNKRNKYELNYLIEFLQSIKQLGQNDKEVIDVYIQVIDILVMKKFKVNQKTNNQSHKLILQQMSKYVNESK